jgi:hypothetical protein
MQLSLADVSLLLRADFAHREHGLVAFEFTLDQPDLPLSVQLAHDVGRHADADDDLRERLALLEALEHLRCDLPLRSLHFVRGGGIAPRFAWALAAVVVVSASRRSRQMAIRAGPS